MSITPVLDLEECLRRGEAADVSHIDAAVTSLVPWIEKVTTRIVNPFDKDRDDIVQEGVIASWRAITTFDPDRGRLDWWMRSRSHLRMLSASTSRSWTTSEEKVVTYVKEASGTRVLVAEFLHEFYHEHGRRPSNREIATGVGVSPSVVTYHLKRGLPALDDVYEVSLDEPLAEGSSLDMAGLIEDRSASDLIEHAVMAYHRNEIAQALDSLTPKQRQYVESYFWGGLSHSEMSDLFGYEPRGIWRGARKNLEKALLHLDTPEMFA